MIVGLSSALVGGVIGLVLGVGSAYFGGLIDLVLQRILDVVMAFPLIILALAVVSIFGTGVQNVIIAITVVYIPAFARLAYGQVLSLREQEYVQASWVLGAGSLRLLFRHILPNALGPVIVAATLGVAGAILAESTLSYLGYGVQPPTPTWGNMLQNAQSEMYAAPWLAIFPGLLIFITIMSINFVGDGLRDALDPRTVR